ncbi:MAG: glycogen synthase [Ignavibacteria bacterium]|nr:glycogen synthase [Ignavibacteria bacterium]
MAKTTSVLFVSTEVYPFIKTGGIADVSYSLPLALRDQGYDIRVMFPKFGSVSERMIRIHDINRLRSIPIEVGTISENANVKSSSMSNPRAKVQAYITTNHKYYDSKKGIYKDPKTGKEYQDNDERFIFFCKTVVETCLILNWFPDIIHCNDWHTALVVAYAKAMFPSKFKKTKVVFTIHNFFKQGVFPQKTFEKTGFDSEIEENFVHSKKFNFLKSALIYSDYITTVSPAYAKEILQEKKLSGGLNSILAENESKFKGILNGIDPFVWDPRCDTHLQTKYNDNFLEYKQDNKQFLLKKFGFEQKENVPLLAMVSRLDEQKGINLFIEAAPELFKKDIQMLLLGDGDIEIIAQLKELAKKNSKKFVFIKGFDDPLAHQIEAGADIFLLPSKYEPCGLNAIYSLAYGTIPVVRATGGLVDIVQEYNPETKEGNGFFFQKFTSASLLGAIKKAMALYQNKEAWLELSENCIQKKYSWEESVKEYQEIYQSIL